MAVRIRLKRMGRRHRAAYRVAAMDGRRSRDSKVIELLGTYDPIDPQTERQVKLDRERIEYWLGVGAQPTDTVRALLKKQGIAVGAA
jgi:small subunit ribosomal protein S16